MDLARRIEDRSAARAVMIALLWCAWQVIRLPALALLTLLAPLVRLLLTAFAMVMTLTTIFFALVSGGRDFPYVGMIAIALGALAILAVYEGLITLLSGRAE